MIQSNELRIGNYLQCANSDNVFQVTSEYISIIDSVTSKARPIPLTGEWLVNFGLIGNYAFYTKIVNNECRVYFKGNFILIVQYVHQLQNLYFALTNKELLC